MKKYITKLALVSTLLLSLNATAGWFWEKPEVKADHVWDNTHSQAWNVMKQVDLEINEYTAKGFERNFGESSKDTLSGPLDFKSNASLGGAVYGLLGGGLWGATTVGMDNNSIFDVEKKSWRIGVFTKKQFPYKSSLPKNIQAEAVEHSSYWSTKSLLFTGDDLLEFSKTAPKEISFFVAPNDRTPWAKQPMLINQGKIYLPIVD